MENLDKLTAAGLPVSDLNRENLDRKDWSKTALGPRTSWSTTLTCLVTACILPMPHCAAIFWGKDLTVIHNLAWEKARAELDGHASSAHNAYSNEALSTLQVVLRGRTVKVATRYFLKDFPGDSHLLLSTLSDEHGARQGVLAQLLENHHVERYMPIEGLDKLARERPGRQIKTQQAQQHGGTEQQQADYKQTNLFQRFAELVPNGLAILDKDAEAIFVNDGFFKLTTNKGQNEFRAWPESIHEDDYDRVMAAYRNAFKGRREMQIEFRCALADRSEKNTDEWRLFLLRPLSDDPEAGYISAVIDITDIKNAQITQEKAAHDAGERKEQQERFIDMVSHEIRNPLSAVMHLAEEMKEVAREISSTHEDIRDQVADILDAADTILLCVSHQNTLVDDILSFSKLDSMMLSLVPRETRPKWEFAQALKVFQSEFKAKNIKFHYAMDVSYDQQVVDYVIADLNRMKQVLVNLITNAIKFTSRKHGERKITVSMGASVERPSSYPPNVIFFSEDSEQFHVDSTKSAEWGTGDAFYLMVAVRDTGIGINTEGQMKLFERFRQATPKTQEKYGGSGLGLFISRKLCTLHGGDIGVSSREGEGSTFGFFFKARRSDGTSADGRPPFQSRSNSENSNASNQTQSPQSQLQTPRPGYSRANSNLQSIKERLNEHPEAKARASQRGGDEESFEPSLKNPPTEYMADAHPASSRDGRYVETKRIADKMESDKPRPEKRQPNLDGGETARQEIIAREVSRSQSDTRSENKQTLLLVEDNLINQKVLRRQLQSRGFEVFTANNGQEAIDAVAKRGEILSNDPTDRNYFDCILMDQEMPIKDGNAATVEIRQLQKDGKAGYSHILGVSANVREAQTDSMRAAGMDDFISKPYKVDDLVKRVRSLFLDGGHGKRDNKPDRRQRRDEEGDRQDKHLTLPFGEGGGQETLADEENGRQGEARGGERSRSRAPSTHL